mgnify:CR=1 FL=1
MKIIGRIEKIDIINLNIQVQSKIGTGAWRNTLHVDEISKIDNVLIIKIDKKEFTFNKFKIIKVKSSFGRDQTRYAIKLKFKIGDEEYKSSFSLTDRSQMKYPCLLGRYFLGRNGFIVDVSKKNVNDRSKKS